MGLLFRRMWILRAGERETDDKDGAICRAEEENDGRELHRSRYGEAEQMPLVPADEGREQRRDPRPDVLDQNGRSQSGSAAGLVSD